MVNFWMSITVNNHAMFQTFEQVWEFLAKFLCLNSLLRFVNLHCLDLSSRGNFSLLASVWKTCILVVFDYGTINSVSDHILINLLQTGSSSEPSGFCCIERFLVSRRAIAQGWCQNYLSWASFSQITLIGFLVLIIFSFLHKLPDFKRAFWFLSVLFWGNQRPWVSFTISRFGSFFFSINWRINSSAIHIFLHIHWAFMRNLFIL